ncbi:DUF6531 domain-containing protein [Pseudomonas sp. Irchel 3A5]|uniref:DUF6531 domain-containing protein n=1 Tax=Pseudomonas sp. Irchel 3A5 TaxID=2008911 RepID=UPI000BA3CC6A|nr:DUF6531 domain-containing protein [Pseudomonas sp. Irchel 3A5]
MIFERFFKSFQKLRSNCIVLFWSAISRYFSKSIIFFISTIALPVHAEAPYFWASQKPPPEYPKYYTADAGCQDYEIMKSGLYYYTLQYFYFDAGYWRPGALAQADCNFFRLEDNARVAYLPLGYSHGDCPAGQTLNARSGECEVPDKESRQKSLGKQDSKLTCSSPLLFVADPINLSNGNSFQTEVDFVIGASTSSLSFVRYYNSFSGLWSSNYSFALWFTNGTVTLNHAEGRQSQFERNGSVVVSSPTELGSLIKRGDNWIYTSSNQDVMTFNDMGQLIVLQERGQSAKSLSYNDGKVSVVDARGHKLVFTQDAKFQPLSLDADGISITYTYSATGHLAALRKMKGGVVKSRQYLYELKGKPGLLTGIIDERGVRYVSWGYDDQGRANSNELANGVERTVLRYGDDGSTRVTNSLGKNTVYRYQVIDGVKRIVAIEGEPSPNCPASNSAYTYNERGQVVTRTDAKGLITTYSYNERGLEVSRIEGNGTSMARTFTTEWDTTLFLPLRVQEPTRVTTYSYDSQGREISRQITSK